MVEFPGKRRVDSPRWSPFDKLQIRCALRTVVFKPAERSLLYFVSQFRRMRFDVIERPGSDCAEDGQVFCFIVHVDTGWLSARCAMR